VLAPSGNDKSQSLGIWDGVGVTYSAPVPHDDKWHWMTVTRTLDPGATELRTYAYVLSGTEPDTDDFLYVDAAVLVRGNLLPAFPPGIE
jgi:hypothetical protein